MAETNSARPPELIGPYTIEGLLGQGVTGKTYQGRHTGLNRLVAIKLLNSQHIGRGNFSKRFQREAQVLASLDHPNIVAIHDCGNHDGQLYMVLELVDGSTVREVIEEMGMVPMETVLRMVREVLLGLECAHRQGILHRDIKPDNLLVNASGQVKIADFGLAKLAGLDNITRAGCVVGTPHYMAPEQCGIPGWPSDIDETSDLYAVGTLIYELLTGTIPFRASTLIELAAKKVSEEPQSPRTLRPETPLMMVEVIKKLLKPRRNHRFQSAREVLDALDEVEQDFTPNPEAAPSTPSPEPPSSEPLPPLEIPDPVTIRIPAGRPPKPPPPSYDATMGTVRIPAGTFPKLPPREREPRKSPSRRVPRPAWQPGCPLKLRLRSSDGDYEVELIPGRPCTFGRSSQRADLAIRDQRLSRLHCEVRLTEDGGVWIRDLGSSNGTFVNDRRIAEGTQISHGDLVQVGNTVLTVDIPQVDAPAQEGGLSCSRCGRQVRPGSIVDGRAVVLQEKGKQLLVCSKCSLDAPLEERLKSEGFVVEERIDRTGRTLVYRAKRSSTDEVMALRVLDLDQPTNPEGFADQFLKDARSLARLHHPSSPLVYDVRKRPRMLYVVMEYVPGEPLSERVERRGPLPLAEALQLIFSVARVCELCEGQDLFHQNVSPKSVMVTASGDAKLTAFALGGPDMRVIPPHRIRYVAPERIRGDDEVDHARAEIYSLGAVLNYALTGQPVHPDLSNDEYRRKVRERQLDTWKPTIKAETGAVKEELNAFLARTLEVDPAKRFATLTEMAHEFESTLKTSLMPGFGGSAEALFALMALDQGTAGTTEHLTRKRKTRGMIAGSFAGDELAEFLQMVGLNLKTGSLRVLWDGGSGAIYLKQGSIVGGVAGDTTGREAARLLIRTQEGTFEFQPELPDDVAEIPPIQVPSFLLDVMRLDDERQQ